MLIDQFFWKPLVTVADRYKLELTAGEDAALLGGGSVARGAAAVDYRRTGVPSLAPGSIMRWTALTQCGRTGKRAAPCETETVRFNTMPGCCYSRLGLAYAAAHFVISEVGFKEVRHARVLGSLTARACLVSGALSTVIWTPIGVAIGFSPEAGAHLAADRADSGLVSRQLSVPVRDAGIHLARHQPELGQHPADGAWARSGICCST